MGTSESFLSSLSSEDRVRISNLNPIYYQQIINEKQGEEIPEIVMEDQTVPDLLRSLQIDELKKLLASVEAGREGDKAASLNDMSRAAECYKQAIDINPYSDLAHMSYGCALGNLGNFRDGIRSVQKALDLNPNNERAKQNIEALRDLLWRSY